MKRLRKLRDLDRIPISTSWDAVRATVPAGQEVLDRGPSHARRAIVIAVAFGLFAASVGVFLFTWGDDAPSPAVDPPTPAVSSARSLTVFCAEDGTTVSSKTVALGRTGVQVTVQNPDAVASLVLLRDPENPDGKRRDGPRPQAPARGDVLASPRQVARRMLLLGHAGRLASATSPWPSTRRRSRSSTPTATGRGSRRGPPAAARCPPPRWAPGHVPLVGPLTGRVVLGVRDPESGATSLVSVAADGADAQALFPDLVVEEAVFSPDGSRVALVNDDSDGDPTVINAAKEDSEIYVANADGLGSPVSRTTSDRTISSTGCRRAPDSRSARTVATASRSTR